jgi:hypothetical protein
MKKDHIPLALLFLAFAFPPCDTVYPAEQGSSYGEMRNIGSLPERRVNAGFLFLGSVGGRETIRYPQWLIQMGVLAGLAYFLRGRSEK